MIYSDIFDPPIRTVLAKILQLYEGQLLVLLFLFLFLFSTSFVLITYENRCENHTLISLYIYITVVLGMTI